MKTIGFVGLGDMGLPMAVNIVKAGFPLVGFDLRAERLALLEAAGGRRAGSCRELGGQCDSVFVMVFSGAQAREAVLGDAGLIRGLKPGATVIVSATMMPREAQRLEAPLAAAGVGLIDTPVSGGKAGADGGALTLMAAAKAEVLEANRDALDAVSKQVFHVGEEIGQGQSVKAALQVFIGATFAAAAESLVLASKSGVSGRTMFDVIGSGAAGSPMFENCARMILDRKFKDTGSRIGTMYKDLGISLGLAHENGAAMFLTSAVYEMFQSGVSLFPDEDNWAIVKLLERIAGTQATW